MSAALERRERARQAMANAQAKAKGMSLGERGVEANRLRKAAQDLRAQADGLPAQRALGLHDLARSFIDRAQIFEAAA